MTQVDLSSLRRAVDDLHRTATNLSGVSAAEFPDAVGNILVDVHTCLEEIINVLDDAGIAKE